MASEYPDALDPAIPTLRDDVDTFRINGLQHIADMAVAAQTIMGTDIGDTTSQPGFGGSKKFGNLSQAMQQLFRWESGIIDTTWDPGTIELATLEPIITINFDFLRFTQPPMVLMQTIEANQDIVGSGTPSSNGYRESKLFPVNISRIRFSVAAGSKCARTAINTSGGIPIKGFWLAIEPPFGFAEADEDDIG